VIQENSPFIAQAGTGAPGARRHTDSARGKILYFNLCGTRKEGYYEQSNQDHGPGEFKVGRADISVEPAAKATWSMAPANILNASTSAV
jgi:hypothetical protein